MGNMPPNLVLLVNSKLKERKKSKRSKKEKKRRQRGRRNLVAVTTQTWKNWPRSPKSPKPLTFTLVQVTAISKMNAGDLPAHHHHPLLDPDRNHPGSRTQKDTAQRRLSRRQPMLKI